MLPCERPSSPENHYIRCLTTVVVLAVSFDAVRKYRYLALLPMQIMIATEMRPRLHMCSHRDVRLLKCHVSCVSGRFVVRECLGMIDHSLNYVFCKQSKNDSTVQ